MPSPFPGMDPYLQRFWPSVRNKLVTYLSDELNTGLLPPDLSAEMTERELISSPDESYRRRILPDIYVVETATSGSGSAGVAAAGGAGTVAMAEPVIVRWADEPVVETAIRITDLSGATLITAVEVLSASNKLSGPDREMYLRKRDEYYTAGVNSVEIDLFRGGERTMEGIDEFLPPPRRSPYLVLVRRAARPDQREVYPLPLRARLPAFPVPLRPGEADVVLDLQPLLDRVYANGRYPIDYAREPDPPLGKADAAWADELLRAAGRRGQAKA